MTKIKTLKNWNEDHTKRVPIAPRTHVKAVFDDEGNTLDSIMAVQDEKLSELGQRVIYDVSKNNDGATFASLSALLSSENLSTLIPIVVRCGGMSIRFVQSSDNKYVQARCMAQNFTTDVTQWQGVDDEPMGCSNNLVLSGGVYNAIDENTSKIYSIAGGEENINFSECVTINMLASSTNWSMNDNYSLKFIPISRFAGGVMSIKAPSSTNTEYAFLKVLPKSGDSLSSTLCEGTTNYSLLADKTATKNVPDDCIYLYVYTRSGSVDKTPQYVRLAKSGTIDANLGKFGQRFPVVYTAEPLIISSDRTITLARDLTCRIDSTNYTIPLNSSFEFTNINGSHFALWAIVFDTANLSLVAKAWSNTNRNDIIILTLRADPLKIKEILHCVVPYTLDGKFFSIRQTSEIDNSINEKTSKFGQRFPVVYTAEPLIISSDRTITLARDLTCRIDSTNYTIPLNSSFEFTNINGSHFALWAIVFDTANLSLVAKAWSNTNRNDIIIATVTAVGIKIGSIIHCVVPYTLDGKYFTDKQTDEIKEIIKEPKTYGYFGDKINLCNFDVRIFKSLSNASWSQSMAIYSDYVIFFTDVDHTAKLFSISSGAMLESFAIPNGEYYQPHCNTAVIGKEFASSDSIMPLIYVSQWDAGHERACFVYDVSLTEGEYTLTLVQKINLASVSASMIGSGQCDFVVDRDTNKLYAIAYKTPNTDTAKGTATMICAFDLPELSDGSEIIMSDSDIVSNFEMELIKYRQDAFMRNGKIYLAHGGINAVPGQIIVIDILLQRIVTTVPINQFINSEPECLDIYDKNKILFNFGTGLYILDY